MNNDVTHDAGINAQNQTGEDVNVSDEADENDLAGGTISDESGDDIVEDNDDLDSDGEYSDEPIKPKKKLSKNARKVKKHLAEKNELKTRVEMLEIENAIGKLKLNYGEFDDDAVKSVKQQHPTLTWEQAYTLSGVQSTGKSQDAPAKPKPTGSIAGRPAPSTGRTEVTMQELDTMPYDEYNKVRDLIDQGKIKVVKKT